MSFNAKYFIAADNEIKRTHAANLQKQEQRKAEISEKLPKYRELSRLLAQTGGRLVTLFSSGVDGKNISESLSELEKENLKIQAEIEALLVSNGYRPDYLKPIYSCEKCKDTGIYADKRCDCFMNIVKKLAGDELNKKSPIRLSSFEDFDLTLYPNANDSVFGLNIREVMTNNYKYCKSYAEDFHLPTGSIIMYGRTGLGKTHLSLAIAETVLKAGYGVIYGSTPDLLHKIEQEHFGKSADDETLDLLYTADLLILDDLGAEFNSAFYTSALYNLINTRINARLPMIINTNLNASELNARYEERIASRLLTMKMLLFLGKDIRQLKK